MASHFTKAVAASTDTPPEDLRPLLDELNGEIAAGDTSTVVIVELV